MGGGKGSVKLYINSDVQDVTSETKITVKATDKISIEAFPEEGYEFDYWELGDGLTSQENPFELTGKNYSNMIAHFKEKNSEGGKTDPSGPTETEWTVKFIAGGNGSMAVTDGEGNPIQSGDKVKDKTEITVLLTPDANYQVDELQIKYEKSSQTVPVVNNSFTTVVTSNIEFVATFKVDINGIYDLKVSMEEPIGGEPMGKVYIDNPETTSLSARYQESHTFYAIPNEGYSFVGWRDADKDYIRTQGDFKNGIYYYAWLGNVDENLVGVFDFELTIPRTITVKSNDATKGTVNIDGEKNLSVTTRKYVTLRALPLSEYDVFESWTDDNNIVVSTEPSFTYKGKENIDLTANFFSEYPVNIYNDGNSEITVYDSNGNEIESGTRIRENSSVRIVCNPDIIEELVNISVNGEILFPELNSDKHEITILVKEPLDIEILWEIKKYDLTVETSKGGEIYIYTEINEDKSPKGNHIVSGQKVEHGTTIHIFSFPNNGYSLEKISVNDVDMTEQVQNNYLSHNMVSTANVKADFKAVTSAIGGVYSDSDSTEVRIYDMQGRRIYEDKSSLRPGIYIIWEKDKVTKVLIK